MRNALTSLALLVVLLLPATVFAQASLTGTVRDASGGVLPGVTVEAASPALIEKVRTAVTDDGGQYRIVDLRPGVYALTFTLPGFSTVVRDKIELTGSQASDSPRLPGLIAGVAAAAVLADKGYDSDANRAAIRRQGAEPCIPPRKNRKEPIPYDRHVYGARNVVERYFGRIKQYRRVATRFDKRARNYLGFVWLATIDFLLA